MRKAQKSNFCEIKRIGENAKELNLTNCFSLYYILSGQTEIELDGELFEGEADMLFFRKPNGCVAFENGFAEILRLDFSGDIACEESLAPLAADPDSGVFYISGEDVAVLRNFFSEAEQNGFDAVYLRALTNCILAKAAQSCDGLDVNTVSKRTYLFVAQHFRGAVSLETASENAALTPTYFSEVFKKETGQTFKKLLTDTRLGYAKRLLSHTELPVCEVCGLCGFGDLANFIRSFGKAYGVSPNEYRKNANK